jgi:hypothetical protein
MGRMKHEYHEGPKAGENFKRLATAVLQTPKIVVAKPESKPWQKRKAAGKDKA